MADEKPRKNDLHRRQRGKNIAVAAVLVLLILLFYVITIVRIGGS